MALAETLRSPAPARFAPVVFTATIFLSASLLFFVQPLFAKIVLPVIGGAPSVWITAMLFFQTVLLAGYIYAHLSTKYLPVRAQVAVHMALFAVALFFLPPGLPEGWTLDPLAPVAPQTLMLFALGIGVPFALLSSNAPLIQSWYARSGAKSADDPYFLYGASNLGSLIALMAFPLVAERYFGAGQISQGFAFGFFLLGAGLLTCGGSLFRSAQDAARTVVDATPAPSVPTLAYWAALGFVPSSLMLAVTSKTTTDLGAVPLLWVIPLALFLLSFVLAFGKLSAFSTPRFRQITQLLSIGSLCVFAGLSGEVLSAKAAMFLFASFFVIATWFHRHLYDARPDAQHLTIFYVTMSVGGALGGLFNSLVGPMLFPDYWEGAITLCLALAVLLFAMRSSAGDLAPKGFVPAIALGGVFAAVALLLGLKPLIVVGASVILLTVLTCLPMGLPIFAVFGGLWIALPAWFDTPEYRIFADRSFFGRHEVDDRDDLRIYSNGTTMHGAQRIVDLEADRPEPLLYYHPEGTMGLVMQSAFGRTSDRIGIVGLGVGSLACYAQPGQDWHYYEIDAMVDQVARDPNLFTFLSACTPDAPTHLGDARVVLANQDAMNFDVLVIDAYSSNAVPVHLTTLEALELYMSQLDEGGALLFHISNRYYDIGKPLARSAEALGLSAYRNVQTDRKALETGYYHSDVVLITRTADDALPLMENVDWAPLASDGGEIWTDDKANPLSILKRSAFR